MSAVELARVRLRAGYAIVAALWLLLVVPWFAAAVVAPTGYNQAVVRINAHEFAPLLGWINVHYADDRWLRVVQLIPYLLLVGLPGSLRTWLWSAPSAAAGQQSGRNGTSIMWVGRAGFGLSALVGVLGIMTSGVAAAAYGSARTATAAAAAVDQFAASYAVETLLARVAGGALIAVFVVGIGLRIVTSRRLAPWIGYGGMLVAALEASAALFFALTPAAADVPTSSLAYFALALWLLVLGVALVRSGRLTARATTHATPAERSAARSSIPIIAPPPRTTE